MQERIFYPVNFFTKKLPCSYVNASIIYIIRQVFQILNSTFPSFGHIETVMSINFDLLKSATEMDMHLRRQAGSLEFNTDRWGLIFFQSKC